MWLPSSFGAKCNNRINPRSAARGEPACDHHRDAEDDDRANARDQIRSGHFGPLISDQTHNSISRERACTEAQQEQHRALLRNELNDQSSSIQLLRNFL